MTSDHQIPDDKNQDAIPDDAEDTVNTSGESTEDTAWKRFIEQLKSRGPGHSRYVFKGEVAQIKEVMAKSTRLGMRTFDQSLFDLYEEGVISYEEALRNADSMNELRLQIKLHGKEAADKDMTSGLDHLNIV